MVGHRRLSCVRVHRISHFPRELAVVWIRTDETNLVGVLVKTMLSQPVAPPSSPSSPSVVHIGFEPCRRSGYEGRTCFTIDTSFFAMWLALQCTKDGQNSLDLCVEASDSMQGYIPTSKVEYFGVYTWHVHTGHYNNTYYRPAPPTSNTSGEYLFVVREGYTLYPDLDVLTRYSVFLQNPWQRPSLPIVWLLHPPATPPPSPPPSPFN